MLAIRAIAGTGNDLKASRYAYPKIPKTATAQSPAIAYVLYFFSDVVNAHHTRNTTSEIAPATIAPRVCVKKITINESPVTPHHALRTRIVFASRAR